MEAVIWFHNVLGVAAVEPSAFFESGMFRIERIDYGKAQWAGAAMGTTMVKMRRFLVFGAAVCGMSTHAEEAKPLVRTLEEFRSHCIPLWPDAPTTLAGDCTVAEFGELVQLDGSTFYFARYHDRTRPTPDSVGLPPSTEFNALVLIRADPAEGGEGTVVHVRKREGLDEFLAPVLLRTARGPVLYLAGRGIGDSHSQYGYDEYLLWQAGTWVELDVHSWVYGVRNLMPDGYRLKGIIDLAPSLETLEYVSTSVLRDGDGDCCPTGGTVSIRFYWDDLTLRVASFEHDARRPPTEG